MYNLGVYVPRKSPIHDLDPRVKIIVVIILSLVVFHVNMIELTAITGTAFIISLIARIPLTSLGRSLRPVLFFFFCLFLLYLFFTPGRPLPGVASCPIKVTFEGLIIGVLQIWKFLLLIVFASLLTATTSASQLTAGLEHLMRPLKVVGISSYDVATMVSLAFRFIPALLDETNTIREAQLARGATARYNGISGRIRSITNLAVPLSVSVIRHADQLVDAMEARGYKPGGRTYLYNLTFTAIDYCVLIVSFVVLISFFI